MHLSLNLVVPLFLAISVHADFLGPTYPSPADLYTERSGVSAAWKNLTPTLNAYLLRRVNNTETALLVSTENITFSIGLFSIHDANATKLQYHWTSPEISHSQNGTKKVDGNSIYRIASAAKLFTVYAGLLTLTEEEWNRPLSNINKAPAQVSAEGGTDPVWHIDWSEIRPWALASQISGVPREGWPYPDTLFNYTAYDLTGLPAESSVTAWGMPPIDIFGLGVCWNISAVYTGQDAVKAIRSQPPVFLPWSTPMYANDNFMLLGLMISNIIGRNMFETYKQALFEPLQLNLCRSANQSRRPRSFRDCRSTREWFPS